VQGFTLLGEAATRKPTAVFADQKQGGRKVPICVCGVSSLKQTELGGIRLLRGDGAFRALRLRRNGGLRHLL
jgi:hypothetical protein